MRIAFPLFVLVFLSLIAGAQNSLDFRQFWFNPFWFNPAYAGENRRMEFGLAHRQQWVDFEDSPNASGFSFQYPVKSQVSFGLNFFSQKSVAMRTSSSQVAFAYKVPLAENQYVRFALSGGLGIDNLDLEGRDYSNDPLILEAAQNRTYAVGSFGLLYSLGELKIGIALPTLFNQQGTGSGVLRTHPMEHLLNQLYSVRYRFALRDPRFAAEPYLLYRLNRDFQNYWEIGGIFHFDDRLQAGMSYQQYNGAAIYFGLTFVEKFRLVYNYEVPRKKYAASGSHEFQLSIRLGDGESDKSQK